MNNIKTLFITLFLCYFLTGYSQNVPQGINYQCVVRDNSGNILSNQSVFLRYSILDAAPPNGNVEYSEIHNPTTNQLALVNLLIGGGTVLSGNFSAINWALGNKYLQIELDPDGNGSSPLVLWEQVN